MCIIKLLLLITDYQILGESYNSRTLVHPMISLVTLHVTSTCVLLLYTWYVHMFYATPVTSNDDPHSVGTLLKTMIHSTIDALHRGFVGIPSCVGLAGGVRYFYLLLYTGTFVFSCVLLMPFAQGLLRGRGPGGGVGFFCENDVSFMVCMFQHPTFVALYRSLATLATFYLVMCVVLVNVNTRNSRRDVLQNGAWLSKVSK